jgi:hypothetical protein
VNDIALMEHSLAAVYGCVCVLCMVNATPAHGGGALNNAKSGRAPPISNAVAENATKTSINLRGAGDLPPLDVWPALAPLAGMVRSSAERMNSLALSLLWLA